MNMTGAEESHYKRAVNAMSDPNPNVSALGDAVSDLITTVADLRKQVEELRQDLHDHQQLHRD